MRRFWMVGALMLIGGLVGGCGGGSGGGSSTAQSTVQARSRAFGDALIRHDKNTLSDFISESFKDATGHDKGGLNNRFDDLMTLGVTLSQVTFSNESFQTSSDGSQVVQTGRIALTGTDPTTQQAATATATGRFVWVNEGGTWRITDWEASEWDLNGVVQPPTVKAAQHRKAGGRESEGERANAGKRE